MANEFNIKNGFISNGDSSISGRLTTEKLTITSGATNGYVLTSDASGNGSWTSASSASVNIYNTDGTLSGNRTVTMSGNTLLFNNAKIGINATPTVPLQIQGTAIPSTNENLFIATVSDATGSYFSIQNGTTADGSFQPKVVGRQSATSNATAVTYAGIIDSTQDSGSSPVTSFQSHLNTLAPVVTRPIFQFRNWATNVMTILANGNVGIGTASPTEKLEVNGKTKTTTFQMTSGATNGYVLTSDASGNASWQTPFPQWSAITTNVSSSDITTIINSGGTISILSAPPSGYTYDWNGVIKYNYGTTPYNNGGGGYWVIRQGADEMAYGFNLNAISNNLLWHAYPGSNGASSVTQNYDQGLSIGIGLGPINMGDGDIVIKLTYRLIQI